MLTILERHWYICDILEQLVLSEEATNFLESLKIIKSPKISLVAKVIVFRGFLMAIALWGTSLWVKLEVDVTDN